MPKTLPPGEAQRRKKERDKARQKKWREENPEKYREQWMRRKDQQAVRYQEHKEEISDAYLQKTYGITTDDYNRMLTEQNNTCAICGDECVSGKKLAVDHNHDTGAVRGLLCCKCNRGLGIFNDQLDLLRSAVLYLEKY